MDDCETNIQSNGDGGFCCHGCQGLHAESLLESERKRASNLAFPQADLP
jgi:hypothetical protein